MKKDETDGRLGRIDRDIERISDNVDRSIRKTESRFSRCPKCGLPTHSGQDAASAFCAHCNTYYRISEKKGDKKLKAKDRRISTRSKIITAAVAVGIILLIGSLGLVWFLVENDLGYIDIHDVNDIRGLPIAKNIPQRTMSTSELNERLREPLDEDEREYYTELEIFYRSLFIIPDDWNLVDIVENESSGAGIQGFYDPETGEMYVISDRSSRNRVNSILSHEYTHALQDQNFDLESYMETGGYDSDFARLCAIEGDAMLTMNKWMKENLNDYEELLVEFENIAQLLSTLDFDSTYVNEILSEMTYFPYEGGLTFVEEVYEEGGYEAVNGLFTTKPPLSSEQVLHYHKYKNYEEPLDVNKTLDIDGFDLQFTSVVGEKLLTELLEFNAGGIFPSTGLASGWGGDSFQYYHDGEDFIVLLATRWDSMVDNNRFFQDYTTMASRISSFQQGGVHIINGNRLYIETGGDSTNIYYTSSEDAMATIMG
ncbi:MAG: hypothetical protein ACMUHB_01290 [Thermoplasmatota archaeon]